MNNQKRDVVIVGDQGMLGQCFPPMLAERSVTCAGFDVPAIDITNLDSVRDVLLPIEPRVVINCAAYTDVDGAETDEAAATKINGDGVANLADVCRHLRATLVHYSTDYVFPGDATEPYAVDEPHSPINAYGRSKAVGERALMDSGCPYVLIRTSWLYAAHGNNFVRTIAKLCEERDELQVVADQRGRPTSAPVLADITLRLIDAGVQGIFHGTNDGETTWHGFATAIGRAVNPNCAIKPCSTDAFPRPAKRPAYSVLDLEPTKDAIGAIPPWEASLADVLRDLGYDPV